MARAAVIPKSPPKRATRGRPKGSTTETAASKARARKKASTPATATTAAQRKRGAARTTTSNVDDDSDDATDDEIGVIQPKEKPKGAKGRGRPAGSTTSAGTGRGRKAAPAPAPAAESGSDDDDEDELAHTDSAPKKRGRPKAKPAAKSEPAPKPRGRPRAGTASKQSKAADTEKETLRKNTRANKILDSSVDETNPRQMIISTNSTLMRSNMLRGPAKKKTVTFQDPSGSESEDMEELAAPAAGRRRAASTSTRQPGLASKPVRKPGATSGRGRKPAAAAKGAAKPLSPKKDKQVAKSLSAFAGSDGEDDELSGAKDQFKLTVHSPFKHGSENTGLGSPVRRINFTPKKGPKTVDENGEPTNLNAKPMDFSESLFMSSPAKRPSASPFAFTMKETPRRGGFTVGNEAKPISQPNFTPTQDSPLKSSPKKARLETPRHGGLSFLDDSRPMSQPNFTPGHNSPLKTSPKKGNLGASFSLTPSKASSTPLVTRASLLQSPAKRSFSPFKSSLFARQQPLPEKAETMEEHDVEDEISTTPKTVDSPLTPKGLSQVDIETPEKTMDEVSREIDEQLAPEPEHEPEVAMEDDVEEDAELDQHLEDAAENAEHQAVEVDEGESEEEPENAAEELMEEDHNELPDAPEYQEIDDQEEVEEEDEMDDMAMVSSEPGHDSPSPVHAEEHIEHEVDDAPEDVESEHVEQAEEVEDEREIHDVENVEYDEDATEDEPLEDVQDDVQDVADHFSHHEEVAEDTAESYVPDHIENNMEDPAEESSEELAADVVDNDSEVEQSPSARPKQAEPEPETEQVDYELDEASAGDDNDEVEPEAPVQLETGHEVHEDVFDEAPVTSQTPQRNSRVAAPQVPAREQHTPEPFVQQPNHDEDSYYSDVEFFDDDEPTLVAIDENEQYMQTPGRTSRRTPRRTPGRTPRRISRRVSRRASQYAAQESEPVRSAPREAPRPPPVLSPPAREPTMESAEPEVVPGITANEEDENRRESRRISQRIHEGIWRRISDHSFQESPHEAETFTPPVPSPAHELAIEPTEPELAPGTDVNVEDEGRRVSQPISRRISHPLPRRVSQHVVQESEPARSSPEAEPLQPVPSFPVRELIDNHDNDTESMESAEPDVAPDTTMDMENEGPPAEEISMPQTPTRQTPRRKSKTRRSLFDNAPRFTPLANQMSQWKTISPDKAQPRRSGRRGVFSIGGIPKPSRHAPRKSAEISYPDISRHSLAGVESLFDEPPVQDSENEQLDTEIYQDQEQEQEPEVSQDDALETETPQRQPMSEIFEEPKSAITEANEDQGSVYDQSPLASSVNHYSAPPTPSAHDGSEDEKENDDENVPPPAPATPTQKTIVPPQTFHTVSKVPLKPEGEVSPLKMPRKRGYSISNTSPVRSSPRIRNSMFSPRNPEPPSFSPRKSPRIEEPTTPKRRSSSVRKSVNGKESAQKRAATRSPSPAKTPRRNTNAGEQALGGAIVHVDVHTTEGEDASGIFVELLQQMGARCVKNWSWNPRASPTPADSADPSSKVGITHVVFKDGGVRTLEKVRQAGGLVKCVGVGWVLDCERENKWLDEAQYAVDSSIIPRGGAKRRKSMEPRALSNVNGTLVKVDSATASASGRRSGADWDTMEDFMRHTPPLGRDEPSTPQKNKKHDDDYYQVPKTPGPGFNLDNIGMSPATPFYLTQQAKLVQQTCPAKQTRQGLFSTSSAVDDESSKRMRFKLDAARRKSLAFKPRVGSPLVE
ncbi:hypothetical protein ASPWEDRAFT_23092 [Aspergillus wentii DTO 134E9]|uniref:BRCT domain-containing protein n=1 Tax=Aspergillus wentii DTO 134E9 TaxID=1073089 RepID=A0A1L9S1B4_ASPWE|nr:uncharacterized protein ASPWEDRAFT_23092 [Aspergillus wentii DTO 134E9]OJJ40965.1 hypothetical protein ASPWEDRAFT_23092 [Aspergillus wentii DTO 134E9]